MVSAYERPKNPERVRQSLLDCAASIAANQGLQAVTIAQVSLAAGVTKGALFHHFANKQVLINAMLDQLIAQLDTAIDTMIEADSILHGRFTRAYVCAALSMDVHLTRNWSALIGSLIGGNELAKRWQDWLSARLRRHATTDNGLQFEIVRMAADGAWLNLLIGKDTANAIELEKIRNRLVDMTKLIVLP